MNALLPGAADIRSALKALAHAELQKLAHDSGVPFTTIWKIRAGTTENPGIETVRQFLPHMPAACGLEPGSAAEGAHA